MYALYLDPQDMGIIKKNSLNHYAGHILCRNQKQMPLHKSKQGRLSFRAFISKPTNCFRQMDHPFDQKKLQELVLYQAIVHSSRTTSRPETFGKKRACHTQTSFSPRELNPGVRRTFEKLKSQLFYQSDWWSAVHSDKGLIIDVLA